MTGTGSPRSAPAQFKLGEDMSRSLASAGIVMVTVSRFGGSQSLGAAATRRQGMCGVDLGWVKNRAVRNFPSTMRC